MAIISRIENALLEIDCAQFQELCNRYLYYVYNPHSINPVGSVVGKIKTRKGTPDTFFVNPEDNFTFIEYTTKERLGKSKSFFKKIKNDILKCFDEKNTSVSPEDISKIIICHTDKLSAAEIKDLTNICRSYNNRCIFEQYGISDLAYGLLNYLRLVESYLDIKVGTGQLMTPSEQVGETKHVVSKETFAAIDNVLFLQLKRWAFRRHANKSREWVNRKYFHTGGNCNWVFAETVEKDGCKKTATLRKLADIPITRHLKIKMDANPFDRDWYEYFDKRRSTRLRFVRT